MTSVAREVLKASEDAYSATRLAFIQSKLAVDASGCWLWQCEVHKWGYGVTWYRGRRHKVHRLLWQLMNGPVPLSLDVCHTCDVRHCANPDHLWIGTRKENIRDMVAKKRGKAGITHCPRGHAYAGDNVRYDRTHRGCKACNRISHRLRAGWSEHEALNTPPLSHYYRKRRAK